MAVCYFIQSHRNPAQVRRLVEALRRGSPRSPILVGHDASGAKLAPEDLAGLGDVDLFHFAGPARRGELSLLEPYFQALDHLAARGVEFDWLVYLSGQDYPVRPLRESEALLQDSGRDGFLTYGDAFAPGNPMGRPRQGVVRYLFQYRTLPEAWLPFCRGMRWLNGLQRLVHIHTTYRPRVGLRARRPPFGPERRCYVGSQWTTLSRSCTEFLRASWQRERELIDYYRGTVCADESLVQTLLVNAGRFRLENDSLRFLRMAGSRDGHPGILTTADLAALTQGRWQFARKFDVDVDAAVLDRLDERLARR